MGLEITLSFPGGKKVFAQVGDFVVETDQSRESGGDGSAPEPFRLFLASIATCSGIYVLDFCTNRGISMEGIRLIQKHEYNREKKRLDKVTQEIHVPKDFPQKYHEALIRASKLCAVKKTMLDPPEMPVEIKIDG
jgi:ribosomal protein S12 methylthiotransferase accessory factor